ncbi:Phytochrome-like protein cph2 [compost metagenome]
MVARLAGDEFTVILNDVEDDSDVSVVAQRIVAALAQPYVLDEAEVETSASVGISLFPSDGEDVAVLLKKADVAMYLAKRQHNGYQFYAQAYQLARG